MNINLSRTNESIDYYDECCSDYNIDNELIEEVEIDGLTPLPKRTKKQSLKQSISYNQAKSAAIFIRRLEYSYNLKISLLYKRYLNQIKTIQRYWRFYREEKKKIRDKINKMKEELRNQKNKALQNFINTISRIYYTKRIIEYFHILVDLYADLYHKRMASKKIVSWITYCIKKGTLSSNLKIVRD